MSVVEDEVEQQLGLFELVNGVHGLLTRQTDWVTRLGGLPLRELRLMMVLRANAGIRQGLLAERCSLSRQAGFVAVKGLIARGLVASVTSSDGREVRLRLTEAGERRLRKARTTAENFRLAIETSFGVEERLVLVRLLERFRVAVRGWDPHRIVVFE